MVRKRSSLFILISIISLFLIAGCGRGGDDTISAASPFLGGSQGLEIKFLKGSPPDEITDTNFPFQAVVSIKNVGEHDITKNQVRVDLSGILASDFGGAAITNIIPADDPSSRKKDSEGNIIDAVETFATIPQSGNLQLQSNAIKGNTKFTFRADVCYQYQTDAIGSICVLQNMIDIADDAICVPKGSRAISSSGSPVKVTSFRQSVVGQNRIQFSFDIVHSGSGNVFENKAPSAGGCPKNPSNKRIEENKLGVTVATGIPQTLTCVGIGSGTGTVTSNNVRLVDGKRTITCTQDVPASDFERNVDINIKFNYLDSIDKNVLAKKLESGTTTQPAITLTANPQSTTAPGQPSTLSWSTANAIYPCTASGGWTGQKGLSGSETFYPTATTTYTLTCIGPSGSNSQSVTVTVGTTQQPTITFTANPQLTTPDQYSTLSWWTANANSCTASGGWVGAKPIVGSEAVSPDVTTQYGLTCYTATGVSNTQYVTVTVGTTSGAGYITASPQTVPSGQQSTLSWSLPSPQQSCTASSYPAGLWSGSKGIQGPETVTVYQTTTYMITCTAYGSGAQSSWATTINVVGSALPTFYITASPQTVPSGQQSTLSWSLPSPQQSCTASSSTGAWSGSKGISGSENVYPAATTTYTLACTAYGGAQSSWATTINVGGITGACGTLAIPRDARTLPGIITNIPTCTMPASPAITDAFLIYTPTAGSASLFLQSTSPAIQNIGGIGFAIRKDNCNSPNVCSASGSSPTCAFQSVAGSTYCVVVNSQEYYQPLVANFVLTRPQ